MLKMIMTLKPITTHFVVLEYPCCLTVRFLAMMRIQLVNFPSLR